MRQAAITTLLEIAKQDEKVLLLSGDLGFGVVDDFHNSVPNQFLNLGITEQSIASVAAGLANKGYKPFIYSIINFATFRCLEQIRNDICYMKLPVTIIGVGAGLGYGNLGYSHFAVEDIAIMRSLPGMNIYSPADQIQVSHSIKSIYEKGEPAYLRLGKGGETNITNNNSIDISQPILLHSGKNGVILSTGSIGFQALKALKILNSGEIFPTLISVPSLSFEIISDFLRAYPESSILTLEEHVRSGGFGSRVLEIANEIGFEGKIKVLGIDLEKIAGRFGSQDYLLEESGLSPESIAKSFLGLLKG